VNVLLNNGGLKGAPVVDETNPTYHNLTGRIEHRGTWNGVVTDHTMIKPGALHRANGGYLIVPARESDEPSPGTASSARSKTASCVSKN
jgi:predicted ATP-dependent protease